MYCQHEIPNGNALLFENIRLFSPEPWIRVNTWTQYKHLELTALHMTIDREAEITMYVLSTSEQLRNCYEHSETLADTQKPHWGHRGARDHAIGDRGGRDCELEQALGLYL
jgi:hypothetical protein